MTVGKKICGFNFWMVPRPNNKGSWGLQEWVLIVGWIGLDSLQPICAQDINPRTQIYIYIYIYIYLYVCIMYHIGRVNN